MRERIDAARPISRRARSTLRAVAGDWDNRAVAAASPAVDATPAHHGQADVIPFAEGRWVMAGWGVIVGGAFVLVVGWFAGVDIVTRVAASLESMKANTALCFVLGGIGAVTMGSASTRTQLAGRAAAAVVAAIAVATIVEYAFGVDVGIDQLLVDDAATVSAANPGRMGLNTAVAFALAALVVFVGGRDRGWWRASAAQVASAGVLALSATSAAGYALGVAAARQLVSATEMALHTSLLFLVLGVALLAATPRPGVLSIVWSCTPGGRAARLMGSAVTAAVVASAGMAAELERLGVIDDPALALAAATTMAVLSTMVAVVVGAGQLDRLARADEVRRRVEIENARLAESNRDLSELAEVIAHDLKSPMFVTGGMLSLLADQYLPPDGPAQDMIERALASVERQSELVDGIVAFAHATGEVGASEQVGLDDVVTWVIETLAVDLTQISIRRVPDPLPIVTGSVEGLRQAMLNLFANSLKYRRPDHPLEVSVEVHRHDTDWEVVVTDNGLGIPVEDRERVFEPGERLGRSGEGIGLGLPSVRRVIERFGGRAWVGAGPGEVGTSVHLTVPVASPG